MSANATTPLDFYPVRFDIPATPDCERCTTGDFCQKVEQKDPLCFEFIAGTCGTEKIGCGDFASAVCTNLLWKTGGGPILGWIYQVTEQFLSHNVGAGFWVGQPAVLTNGKLYKVEITVKRFANPLLEINGSVTLSLGGTLGTPITQSGSYTQYLTSAGVDFDVIPSTSFDGAIDDISVFEVGAEYLIQPYDPDTNLPVGTGNAPTSILNGMGFYCLTWEAFELEDGCYYLKLLDACSIGSFANQVINGGFFAVPPPSDNWTFGTNWAYDALNLKACHTGVGAGQLDQTLPLLMAGLTYNARFTVSNRTAGSLTPLLGGTSGAAVTTNGSFDVLIVAGGTGILRFQADTTFDGCVDDVQVVLNPVSYPADAPATPCYDLREDHPCTTVLSWTNDENAFGADYESVSFTPQIRLEVILNKPNYPREVKRHRFSTGRRKILRGVVDKLFVLAVDQIPEYVFDALVLGITHDDFFIGGVEYVAQEGDIIPEWIKGHLLSNFTVEVEKQNLNLVNKNCS